MGKIAQRIIPHDLEPDVLRLELIDLGDAFRAYQQRTEPNLVLLAELPACAPSFQDSAPH
ncbi:hypothetical protein ACFZCU_47360 [Streptomyces canus]|uniref:hypothetical protein n=1 Tax=Streptomyces canus TaxID=58343 RepID=UPI0036DFED9F